MSDFQAPLFTTVGEIAMRAWSRIYSQANRRAQCAWHCQSSFAEKRDRRASHHAAHRSREENRPRYFEHSSNSFVSVWRLPLEKRVRLSFFVGDTELSPMKVSNFFCFLGFESCQISCDTRILASACHVGKSVLPFISLVSVADVVTASVVVSIAPQIGNIKVSCLETCELRVKITHVFNVRSLP